MLRATVETKTHFSLTLFSEEGELVCVYEATLEVIQEKNN